MNDTSNSLRPEILLEDGPLLAISKPPGLLTQSHRAELTLESWAKAHLRAKYHKPGNVYLGIPHRLDRPVSGVIVFARNSKAAARLAEQFREHQVEKVYYAVLERPLPQPVGTLQNWLLKSRQVSKVQVVPEGTPGARRAVLDFRTIEQRDDGRTLVEVTPRTGRTHQIRVQLAHCAAPIVGDIRYGGLVPAAAGWPAHAIALHARQLTLLHPVRYETLTIMAPMPPCWRDLARIP